jgi:hypothetical protein
LFVAVGVRRMKQDATTSWRRQLTTRLNEAVDIAKSWEVIGQELDAVRLDVPRTRMLTAILVVATPGKMVRRGLARASGRE